MGLEHEFILVSYDEYEEMSYNSWYLPGDDLDNIVIIHDDIILYIHDTLNWIPSINPAMNYDKGFGLNYHGYTLFDKDGAEVIYKIAQAWIDLFSNSPRALKLTGNYVWTTDDKGITNGEYEKIEIERDEIVKSLSKLRLFSEKVITDKYLILHRGI